MYGPTREQMDRVVNMIMYGRNKTFRTAASKIGMGEFLKRCRRLWNTGILAFLRS